MATSMTRKHFEAIAEAVKIARRVNDSGLAVTALDEVSLNLAANLSQFNAHFDRDRFLKACGRDA